jgi:hypothetical protein
MAPHRRSANELYRGGGGEEHSRETRRVNSRKGGGAALTRLTTAGRARQLLFKNPLKRDGTFLFALALSSPSNGQGGGESNGQGGGESNGQGGGESNGQGIGQDRESSQKGNGEGGGEGGGPGGGASGGGAARRPFAVSLQAAPPPYPSY